MTWITAACPLGQAGWMLFTGLPSLQGRDGTLECVFILWLMKPRLGRDDSLSKLLPEVLV